MPSNWDQNSTAANGAHFNYYRTPGTKDSGKPVLILQHGFSDNGLCWGPVAQELAGSYDILMPDARGHGLSARVARGEVIDQAADLAALMRALGVTKAVVAGHSMGAHIVSDLAARFPDLVSAMVLEDPGWFIPGPNAPQFGRGSMEDSPLGKWMISLREKSLEQVMMECHQEHPTWPEPYVRAWCQAKLELDLNFLTAEHPMGNWQDRVRAFKCPVLLITADPSQGGIVTPEAASLAKELCSTIREVNFPGVGHHVRFAVHDAYMPVVKAFLHEVA
jgi:N-formylmaleamate deformylase